MDLDLGHVAPIDTVLRSGNAGFSKDNAGHWVLWEIAGRRAVASGDLPPCGPSGPVACPPFRFALAGDTLAVLGAAGIDLRAASTGAPLSMSPAAANAGLARDGSYTWTATASGLQARSLTGTVRLDVAGDYSQAAVSAEPSLLRIIGGPAGSQALQIIQLADGQSTTVAFGGTFSSWFDDGQHFLTVTGSVVAVYTSAGTRQGFGSLPTVENLTGQGEFVWTYPTFTVNPSLRIYAATDLSAPVQQFAIPFLAHAFAAGPLIGVLPSGAASVQLIQLGAPVALGPQLPVPSSALSAFGGDAAGHWLVAGQSGVVFDGDAIGTPAGTSLSLGAPGALAGSPGVTAVLGTASGRTAVLTLGDADTTIRLLDVPAEIQAAITGDEATLVASGDLAAGQDQALRVVTLADGTITHTFPYLASDPVHLLGFSLARDAGILVQQLVQGGATQYAFTDLTGAALSGYGPVPDDQTLPAPNLTPDGRRAAFTILGQGDPTVGFPLISATTQLYRDGALAGAVAGVFMAWLDNDRALVATYKLEMNVRDVIMDHMTVYDGLGIPLAASALPDPGGRQQSTVTLTVMPIDGQLVYLQEQNAVYDAITGSVVWQGNPAGRQGVVVGNSIVYRLGRDLYRAAFRPAPPGHSPPPRWSHH